MPISPDAFFWEMPNGFHESVIALNDFCVIPNLFLLTFCVVDTRKPVTSHPARNRFQAAVSLM